MAFADDDSGYDTKGVIKFKPGTELTQPIDPTDPTKPILPEKPNNPSAPNQETKGPLSIDFASNLNFGKQKITSQDEVYYAKPQKYTVLNGDENAGTPTEGPNFIQVTDNRGTESGWSLKVKQSGQFQTDSGKELSGAQLSFNNGSVISVSDSGIPVGNSSFTLISDNSQESSVMAATSGNGSGTYLWRWGTDATTGAESIELSIPGATTKYAEKYTTTLEWVLTDVPD